MQPNRHDMRANGVLQITPFACPVESVTMPIGRPTTYTPALAEWICEQIATGRSLSSVMRDSEGLNPFDMPLPALQTVMQWIARYPEFAENYVKASQLKAEIYADETIEIADNCDPEYSAKANVQVKARQWYAERMLPRRYGKEGNVEPVSVASREYDPVETARKIAMLLQQGQHAAKATEMIDVTPSNTDER